jgi:hypothetical protein
MGLFRRFKRQSGDFPHTHPVTEELHGVVFVDAASRHTDEVAGLEPFLLRGLFFAIAELGPRRTANCGWWT